MAAVVAYYLSEVAPPDERRTQIKRADVERYFKQARFRFPAAPGNVLPNATAAGYFDSAQRGSYVLNPVGYNLVVHTLPRGVPEEGPGKAAKAAQFEIGRQEALTKSREEEGRPLAVSDQDDDAWSDFWDALARLESAVNRSKAVNVNAKPLRESASGLVQQYFRDVKPGLSALGIPDDETGILDLQMQALLTLANTPNARKSYRRVLGAAADEKPRLTILREVQIGRAARLGTDAQHLTGIEQLLPSSAIGAGIPGSTGRPRQPKSILETIDMDSYRVEKQAAVAIQLEDSDSEIGPVPTSAGGGKPEPELDLLSNIVGAFNEEFGDIDWDDVDRVRRMITEEIPDRVAADTAYQNAIANSDKQNARIEHDKVLGRVIVNLMRDDTQLFKQFNDNEQFKRWLGETVFALTYS